METATSARPVLLLNGVGALCGAPAARATIGITTLRAGEEQVFVVAAELGKRDVLGQLRFPNPARDI